MHHASKYLTLIEYLQAPPPVERSVILLTRGYTATHPDPPRSIHDISSRAGQWHRTVRFQGVRSALTLGFVLTQGRLPLVTAQVLRNTEPAAHVLAHFVRQVARLCNMPLREFYARWWGIFCCRCAIATLDLEIESDTAEPSKAEKAERVRQRRQIWNGREWEEAAGRPPQRHSHEQDSIPGYRLVQEVFT